MFAHIDADAFFASVLQRDCPKLRGKPVLALGMSGGTTVIAASYEAKRLGVKTGMRTVEARKLAPGMIALPADFRATSLASDQLFQILERWCPGGMERASVDEGYLDLAMLPPLLPRAESRGARGRAGVGVSKTQQPPSPTLPPLRPPSLLWSFGWARQGERAVWEAFAKNLQAEIQRFLDLPISVGIAQTKTLAKMAGKRNKPRGICVVLEQDRNAFLATLPINAIPGIGTKLTPKLQAAGFTSALDLARAPRATIQAILGKTGLELQAETNGISVYAVVTEPDPPQSISRCRSFLPTGDKHFLFGQLLLHLSYCVAKLRREEFECAKIGVWLRWLAPNQHEVLGLELNGCMVGAERKLDRYIAEEALLIPFVKEALEEALATSNESTNKRINVRPCTQCGLVLSDFRPRGPRQVGIFEDASMLERIGRVQQALDALRERFGRESVGYGGVPLTLYPRNATPAQRSPNVL